MPFRDRPPMLYPRAGAAIVTWGNWVLIMGGRDTGGGVSRRVQAYNLVTGQWLACRDLLDPRTGAAAVNVGRKVYLTGGINHQGIVVDKVAVLDAPETGTIGEAWSRKNWEYTTSMTRARWRHTANILAGTIIVTGGLNQNDAVRNTVERMNIGPDSWADLPGLPEPRFAHAGSVISYGGNAHLYITGGRNLSVDRDTVYDWTYAFPAWVGKRPLPSPRALHTQITHEGRIYVAGARTGASSVRSYNPVTDTPWRTEDDLPAPRSDGMAVATQGKMIYFGGADNLERVTSTVWEGPSVPPFPPVVFAPRGSVPRDQPIVVRWTNRFADNGDYQTYAQIQVRPANVASWPVTYTANTRDASWEFPANTFTAGDKRIRVRTAGSTGELSDWSSELHATFVATPAGAQILRPVPGSILSTFEQEVEIFSPGHDAFQVRRVPDVDGEPVPGHNDSQVYWTSEIIRGANRTITRVQFPVNERPEFLQVRIQKDNVWGPWTSASYYISYTPPRMPGVRITAVPEEGALQVSVLNLKDPEETVPDGTPNVARNQLYRAEVDTTIVDGVRVPVLDEFGVPSPILDTEVRVAGNLPPSGTLMDYRVAGEPKQYAYSAVAWGDNGAAIRSPWVAEMVQAPRPNDPSLNDSGWTPAFVGAMRIGAFFVGDTDTNTTPPATNFTLYEFGPHDDDMPLYDGGP